MNDIWQDLFRDIEEQRKGKVSDIVESFFEELMDSFDDSDILKVQKKYHCDIYVSKEKHNQLQYTYYIEISSDLVEGGLHLEIESGINNGTQLNGYSFGDTLLPKSKTVEILKDIVIDDKAYKGAAPLVLLKAKAILDRHKDEIMKLLRYQSYDNYVSGGGTVKTDSYYKDSFARYREMGLFWKGVYEEIEVDINLV